MLIIRSDPTTQEYCSVSIVTELLHSCMGWTIRQMNEIEIYKRFACCKPLKDKYNRLMKTWRLTVVGEAFVTVTQLSWASLENKACVARATLRC